MVPRRRLRWSLLNLFAFVGVCAVAFALWSYVPRPEERFFENSSIVSTINDADTVEVFRLAPTFDMPNLNDEETHETYPIAAGPVAIARFERERLSEMLLDPNTWWNDPNWTTSIVPNYYKHRIRFKCGAEILDIDLSVAHVTLFRNGKVIDGDNWHLSGRFDEKMGAKIDEMIDAATK